MDKFVFALLIIAMALTLGVLCGLVVWLFVAVFHLKREPLLLSFTDREAFVEHLGGELVELGYEPGLADPRLTAQEDQDWAATRGLA